MSARRCALLAALVASLAAPTAAQALNREYYEPVWTKPVTAGANTWWWQIGNDYAGKANNQVAFCFRWRQSTGAWKNPDGTSWQTPANNGLLPAKGCYHPNGASHPIAWQVSNMVAGQPYTYCNKEWLVSSGTWSQSAIPEKCQSTTLDNVAPTTSMTINNGASWTNNLVLNLRIGFGDAIGQFWPANFVCGQANATCTPTTEVVGCNSYPAAPAASCTHSWASQADGTTLHECVRVADSAIPDQTPQTNPNGPNYPPTTYPPNPGNATHNLSSTACGSIRVDRTSPTFAPNTPTTAVVGEARQFSVTDAHSGVAGAPTWTIDGTTKSGATVSHTFTSTGQKSLSVPVSDNAGNSTTLTRSIMVASAPAPAVGLSPESMAFHTDDGSPGGLQTLTITNTGNATLSISAIALAAGSDVEFSYPSGSCAPPQNLAAGASCTAELRYSPANGTPAGATHTGTLRITSNAAGSPTDVPLHGTTTNSLSTPPEVSPNPLAFGVQALGTTSTKTVTFTNAGDQGMTANLNAVVLSGDAAFSRSGGSCSDGQVIVGGASCTVVIAYAPASTGNRTATLTFSHNLNGAGTDTVTITGSTPDAGNDGGETGGTAGDEGIGGAGKQPGGGEELTGTGASSAFTALRGGALLTAMTDALLLRAAGAGKVVQVTAGKLRLRAASRFVVRKDADALPVGLKASVKGTVGLILTKGSKTVAKGSVKLLKAGRFAFALALPKRIAPGRHKLVGTFTPAAGKKATRSLRITFVRAPAKASSRAFAAPW